MVRAYDKETICRYKLEILPRSPVIKCPSTHSNVKYCSDEERASRGIPFETSVSIIIPTVHFIITTLYSHYST